MHLSDVYNPHTYSVCQWLLATKIKEQFEILGTKMDSIRFMLHREPVQPTYHGHQDIQTGTDGGIVLNNFP